MFNIFSLLLFSFGNLFIFVEKFNLFIFFSPVLGLYGLFFLSLDVKFLIAKE